LSKFSLSATSPSGIACYGDDGYDLQRYKIHGAEGNERWRKVKAGFMEVASYFRKFGNKRPSSFSSLLFVIARKWAR
jgi:hypothetical protein